MNPNGSPALGAQPSDPGHRGSGWFARWGFRAKLREVLHLDDEPWKIAGGLAAGVFIAFTPYYGVHTLLALAVAYLFRLNMAATVAGAWLVIPPAIPFVMAFCLKVGWLLVGRPTAHTTLKGASAAALWGRLAPHLWPLVVGTTVIGVVAAIVAYVITHQAVVRVRAARGDLANRRKQGIRTGISP